MGNPTYYIDDQAVADRKAEANQGIPDTAWDGGLNAGGACANGIGVNEGEGAVIGTPAQFTLLDQDSDARTPQNSQLIGGTASALDVGTNPVDGGGLPVRTGGATLASLNAGWTAA